MCLTLLTGGKFGAKLGKLPKKLFKTGGKIALKGGKKGGKSLFLPGKKIGKAALKGFKPNKKASKFFKKLAPFSFVPAV